MKRFSLVLAAVAVVAVSSWGLVAQDDVTQEDKLTKPSREAVNRTRKTVKMLDDIYKTAVVLITDKYVHSDEDFAAGSAAVALFDAIDKKGWHTAELLDVTGDPYDSDNVANDAFEKQAVIKIKNGESYVDAVEVDEDGKSVLRAMTAVPVVLEKCTMCHEHYKQVPAGGAIGAISYAVPIE